MNGWRTSMEDSHLIWTHNHDKGCFGVLDGHGGDECAEWCAKRIWQKLEAAADLPKDDDAAKTLMLQVDAEFLAGDEEGFVDDSGATATMCAVRVLAGGRKFAVHVINAGDSRVMLGSADGSIVDGGGTQQGLTTDHQPSNPNERARVERCGGWIDEDGYVCEEVAVTRGFGDAACKQTGPTPPTNLQEDTPVSAAPEMGHFEAEVSQFLVLVCDGVSEGETYGQCNFPNSAVVELVAQVLTHSNDPGEAARTVCHRAVEHGSTDNISCMVVVLCSDAVACADTRTFTPGQLTAEALQSISFIQAYAKMANRAGMGFAQSCEKRYELLEGACKLGLSWRELDPISFQKKSCPFQYNPLGEDHQREVACFEIALGEPPAGHAGSKQRELWFQKWAAKVVEVAKAHAESSEEYSSDCGSTDSADSQASIDPADWE